MFKLEFELKDTAREIVSEKVTLLEEKRFETEGEAHRAADDLTFLYWHHVRSFAIRKAE